PVPEPAGIGVAGDTPEGAGVVRVRHLVVADDVRPVERYAPPMPEVRDELRRRSILGLGVGAAADPALVLDPDRVEVPPAITRVPGDVRHRHELDDLTAPRDDEMRRAPRPGALQEPDGADEPALG